MFEFLLGISVGVCIGTLYDCKPYVELVVYTIKSTTNNLKEREKDKKIE